MLLCGLDEAGCGPLAGPVVAAAVVLNEGFPAEILSDSKRLSHKKRSLARLVIMEKAFWGIGVVGEKTIDEINILQARLLAMKMAFGDMIARFPCLARGTEIIEAIADGTFAPNLPCTVRCEAKADGKYPPVMAASIMAKEERDSIMIKMDALYPQYGYAKHKGYPTKEHLKVLHEIGPSAIQRMSFKYR